MFILAISGLIILSRFIINTCWFKVSLMKENQVWRALVCLGGVDIFHRSVDIILYFVFTKLSALNAYNDFDL